MAAPTLAKLCRKSCSRRLLRRAAFLKEAAAAQKAPGKPVAVVSCDEKPVIQAIATSAPDLPPKQGVYASFARDYEYKRHGT